MNVHPKIVAGALGLALVAACATSPTGRTQLLVFPESSAIAASKQAYSEMLTPLAKEYLPRERASVLIVNPEPKQ